MDKYKQIPNIKITMKNRNHFIIFAVVIIILIIVAFSSLIITANNNVIQEGYNTNKAITKTYNKKSKNNKIKILIDPGHNAATKGSVGWLGYEYYMTLRLAKQLTAILDEDDRFEYFLSREGDIYSKPIKEYMTNNYEKLLGIYETEIKNNGRLENLTRYQTLELYAIRNYAIDNDYDLLLSLHFDYMPYTNRRARTEGFHVIASPYNGEFNASMQIAGKISEKMRENYKVSPTIVFDRYVPENVWTFYDKNDLLKNGISVRGLIVLGDEFEFEYNKKTFRKDVPSVMLEAGFIHDWKLGGNKALKNIAQKIYEALLDIYIN